ncbi:hypothetical protein HZH68_015838 [Vespula germanica]|uniref:Uncharacterized protein n=1 Tax=Vespula germanica TaxID=30212 RepID=A0A834MRJ9_VESGE|nr:hypothetical protein HZH68_015838 [Vespula germanica]
MSVEMTLREEDLVEGRRKSTHVRMLRTNVLVRSPSTELAYRVAVVKRTVNVRKIQLALAVVIFSYQVTIASQALYRLTITIEVSIGSSSLEVETEETREEDAAEYREGRRGGEEEVGQRNPARLNPPSNSGQPAA